MGVLTVDGVRLRMDGAPFYYQGLSFFNALYNPSFNESDAARRKWLARYKRWGITALRVWGDWRVANGWVDEGPENSLWVYPGRERRNVLFEPGGAINPDPLERLQSLLTMADQLGMVIELALFTHYLVYPVRTRDDFVDLITEALRPWRNCIFQIWNEYDDHPLRHYEGIKRLDPERLVTNSPGGAGVLGSRQENAALDLLTPHTHRRGLGEFEDVAPQQVEMLLEEFGKPVIDDEPARNGIRDFGGRPDARAEQHLLHIDRVRQVGGYHNYHHDMFQCGYGAPSTPPQGIPDPEFSDYHRPVFEHLRNLAPPDVARRQAGERILPSQELDSS